MKILRLAKQGEAEEILKVYVSGGEWLPYTKVDEVKTSIKENDKGKVSLIVVEIDGKIVGHLDPMTKVFRNH